MSSRVIPLGNVIVFPKRLERRAPDVTEDEMTLYASLIAQGWTEDMAAEVVVGRRRIMSGCNVS